MQTKMSAKFSPLVAEHHIRAPANALTIALTVCACLLAACGADGTPSTAGVGADDGARPARFAADKYGLAGGCFVIDAAAPGQDSGRLLQASPAGDGFAFVERDVAAAARFTLEPTDLGTYLLRDVPARYLYANADGTLGRVEKLESDVTRNEDGYVSPAIWSITASEEVAGRFVLKNLASARYLGTAGQVTDAASAALVAFYPSTGCTPFPELTIDAHGEVQKTHFADGTLYGIVDAHEHLFTNLGFGGGGVFHGAPFHPLGVEHALGSCEPFHGVDGRHDMVGSFYAGGNISPVAAVSLLATGDTGKFDHHTDGYPTFTDWPRSWNRATHQTLYYRGIERAWRAGVRLLVQHATTNEVLCELANGVGTQHSRHSCNDMVAVDQIIDATYALERYVDAHAGGPGKGWFRVVKSPAEARKVIGDGKLAVILGIETSTLFDCYVTARPGFPKCTDAVVRAKLDDYYGRGVRAIFPVHKFDNAFSPGDGHRGFIEIGNIANSGYYGNFTDKDCPGGAVFDHGKVNYGGMNQPRDVYDSPPPIDISAVATAPIDVLSPYLDNFTQPALPGEYCQNAGLQPLGETLMHEMMLRGMIIEVDHLPQRSVKRAFELLHQYDYPAAETHGGEHGGDIYALGGISVSGLPRCQDADNPDVASKYRARIQRMVANGAYPAQGFVFDFNGFASGPRPRFGANTDCGAPQTNGMKYPFTSFAGDVVFDPPQLGSRKVDFDTEGVIHYGLFPEYVQTARNLGMSDADLEPFFRSAEGYVRMWERAETRAAALK